MACELNGMDMKEIKRCIEYKLFPIQLKYNVWIISIVDIYIYRRYIQLSHSYISSGLLWNHHICRLILASYLHKTMLQILITALYFHFNI